MPLSPPGQPRGWNAARRAHAWFLLACASAAVALRGPMAALWDLALRDERYTYTISIPFLAAGLVVLDRRSVFRTVRPRPPAGLPVFLPAVAAGPGLLDGAGGLAAAVTACLLASYGAFVACYGLESLRRAAFPFLFLLLAIPPPPPVMEGIAWLLQVGTAEVSHLLFQVTGVPFHRQGFLFTLPCAHIEVAEQCSGIRSSLSLMVAGILAARLLLRSAWSRGVFLLAVVPAVVVKNAVRVVAISCLGCYVDPGFLHGALHQYGGLPFSFVALAGLLPLLLFLYKADMRRIP